MVSAVPSAQTRVVAVVGAASEAGARVLLHLERERPDCWLVAVAERPLRWPVERISTYRLAHNRVGAMLSLSDIPDFMLEKAWDMFSEGHELTIADIPDVLQLEAVDAVVHVGSHYDGPDPERFVAEAGHWVEATRLAGVRQFVYLSDVRVYGIRAGNTIPLTERSEVSPAPEHQYLLDAEPEPATVRSADGGMNIAVLRTAMSVGPGGSSPAADELLPPAIAAGRRRNFPLQFLHQYDLTCAIESAITHEVNGVFNVVGDGVVGSKDVSDICRRSRVYKPASAGRLRRKWGAQLAKYPLIVSATKFKQSAGFRLKYSSARAVRAYCHSVLLEPA